MRLKNLLVAAALLLAAIAPAMAQFSSQATFAGASTGSANAYVLSVPNVATLADIKGVPIRWLPNFTNNGPATVTITGLGALNIMKPSSSGPVALTGSEIVTGTPAQGVEGFYDGTNFILTSNLNAVAASLVITPQGYLTPCNFANSPSVTGCAAGSLIPNGDVTAATTLYYQPAVGNQIPIWNGTAMVPFQFPELTLTLGSTNLANTLYDVCVFSNAGTPTVGTAVAWSTSTAGSGARGSGAGTAQITRVNGIWVNAVTATVKNGASTFSVPANQCTMVTTLLIGTSNGQVSFTRSYGQSRQWAAWNFYNRQPINLKVGDATTSWIVSSGASLAIRPSNNTAANSATTVIGLPTSIVSNFTQTIEEDSSGNQTINIGACYNVTNAFSGLIGQFSSGTNFTRAQFTFTSNWVATPGGSLPNIGANVFTTCEAIPIRGSNNVTFFGTETNMLMTVGYSG